MSHKMLKTQTSHKILKTQTSHKIFKTQTSHKILKTQTSHKILKPFSTKHFEFGFVNNFHNPRGRYGEILPRQRPIAARDFTGSKTCAILLYSTGYFYTPSLANNIMTCPISFAFQRQAVHLNTAAVDGANLLTTRTHLIGDE